MFTKYRSFVSAFFFFTLLPLASQAACVPLSETLHIGSRGAEVQLLQQFLNTSTTTAVAFIGSGPAGSETMYFGTATLKAVKRFQELYKKEVLIPAGLKSASGVVGKFSREFINTRRCAVGVAVGSEALSTPTTMTAQAARDAFANELALRIANLNAEINAQKAKYAVTATATSVTATDALSTAQTTTSLSGDNSTGYQNGPLQIFTLEPAVAKIGDQLLIKGTGITAGAVLRIGNNTYPLNILSDGAVASVVVDARVPLGEYYVTLQKGSEQSNDRVLVVVADSTKTPVISSLTPNTGNIGTVVTLTGENLSAENDLLTSIGSIKDIPSSDGKTLTFTITADPKLLDRNGKLFPYTPYYVNVVNDNGISTEVEFTIK
jgi:hypothetical protein